MSGTVVPDITVSSAPARSASEVEKTAVSLVKSLKPGTTLAARGTRLLIFREGLAKGVPGPNHLAYEVEVGDGGSVREFVYVDAHTGKFIDRISGAPDSLRRRAYDGKNLPKVPPSYPGNPFWVEGQAFPTGNAEARQHDPGVQRHLLHVLQCLRPRFLRWQGRHDGLDIRSRL